MSKIRYIIQLLRPTHWIKNGFIFLPLFFGKQLLNVDLLIACTVAFVLFSMVASSVYVFNDLQDIAYDRLHPKKQFRPLASGKISVAQGYKLCIALATIAILLGLLYNLGLGAVLLAYLVLNIGYTMLLKHIMIIDIVCIALGFLLRLEAGAQVTDILLSKWILGLTFLLSIFLALGKRRSDVIAYLSDGEVYRKTAAQYSKGTIDKLIIVTVIMMLIAYTAYTLSDGIITQMGTDQLFWTAIWVVLGLGRYLYLIMKLGRGGSPTSILITDLWLQIIILAWIANFFVLIY